MRTSATIILVRNTPELEVYWVKRGGDAPFLSGFRVFPGGHIEVNDYLDSSESVEIAARRAALRELREEVGLDLADRMEQLNFLGTWSTPPYLVFPLTAYFFALEIEPSMTWVSESDCEVEDGEWISPGDALLRWASGRVLLAPPTLSILRCLEELGLDSLPSTFTSDEAYGKEPTYSQIHPDKMMIPTRTPTLPPATHTNCYVLGQSDLLVIEPASADSKALDAVIDYLDRKVEEGARIRAVVLTHHHHDHIGDDVWEPLP